MPKAKKKDDGIVVTQGTMGFLGVGEETRVLRAPRRPYQVEKCRSCHEDIIGTWLTGQSGKRVALDPGEDPDGRYFLITEPKIGLRAVKLRDDEGGGPWLYRQHRCPLWEEPKA